MATSDQDVECTSDGECDNGVYCDGPELCSAGECVPGAAPCENQTCSESEQRCITDCDIEPDADGDGVESVACGGTDCDDDDVNRFPGNPEVCDSLGHDEDCDDTTLGDDADSDGYVSDTCCNGTTCGQDCNDASMEINPEATEACNGINDDCDDATDEGFAQNTYSPDCDGDTFGDESATSVTDCRPPVEAPVCATGSGGWVTNQGDCDDSVPTTNEGAVDLCNDVDDDCDGPVDEGNTVQLYAPDCDGDNFGDDSVTAVLGCRAPLTSPTCPTSGVWVTNQRDCDDSVSSTHEGASESCNGVDDDCDTVADNGLAFADYYPDCDGDLFGAEGATPVNACEVPSTPPACANSGTDWALTATDCDDLEPTANTGNSEACDGIDNDCDTLIDEDGAGGQLGTYCWTDADNDGFAELGATRTRTCMLTCPALTTSVDPLTDADCDDNEMSSRAFVDGRRDADEDGVADADTTGCPTGDPTFIAGATGERDCDDGDPNIFPGQTAYFAEPSRYDCPDGPTNAGGQPLPPIFCSETTCGQYTGSFPLYIPSCSSPTDATPVWGYDCDDASDAPPLGTDCTSCGACGGGYIPSGAANCGVDVTLYSCVSAICSGPGLNICIPDGETTVPLPCR